MKKITVDMDMDAEVDAIVDFVGQKWTKIPDLRGLVEQVRDHALHDGRAGFNLSAFAAQLNELSDERMGFVESLLDDRDEQSMVFDYDGVRKAIDLFEKLAPTMYQATLSLDTDEQNKGSDELIKHLAKKIHREFPDLAKSKPLGWVELEKEYQELGGKDQYNFGPDMELYRGVDLKDRASHIVQKISLPHLMSCHKSEGQTPTSLLISSIYLHFKAACQWINTQKMFDALDVTLPIDEPRVLLGLELNQGSGSPHLDILIKLSKPLPSQEEYDSTLQRMKEYAALSAEGKAEFKANHDAYIKDMMTKVLTEDPARDQSIIEQEKQRRHEMKILLRHHFPSISPSVRLAPESTPGVSI